jgi:hypothetical protein
MLSTPCDSLSWDAKAGAVVMAANTLALNIIGRISFRTV